jgi:hypothetical protein
MIPPPSPTPSSPPALLQYAANGLDALYEAAKGILQPGFAKLGAAYATEVEALAEEMGLYDQLEEDEQQQLLLWYGGGATIIGLVACLCCAMQCLRCTLGSEGCNALLCCCTCGACGTCADGTNTALSSNHTAQIPHRRTSSLFMPASTRFQHQRRSKFSALDSWQPVSTEEDEYYDL